MNTKDLTLQELQALMQRVDASQMSGKQHVIAALKAEMANRHLEWFDPRTMECREIVVNKENYDLNPMSDQLMARTVKELRSYVDSFLELNLFVPRDLINILEYKQQIESDALLQKLVWGQDIKPKEPKDNK